MFANFPQTLGYIYKGEEGINYYNPNLLELDYDTITKDPSDLYIDLHSEIIGDYDNIDNTIYFIDYDSFKKSKSSESSSIENIYFSNLRSLDNSELPIKLKEYADIYKNINENTISFNQISNEKKTAKFELQFKDIKLSNLMSIHIICTY